MAQHPSIQNAYVVGAPHSMRGEVAVAFVDGRGGLSEDGMKEFAHESVSSCKVPRHVVFHSGEQLPQLARGEVAKHRWWKKRFRSCEERTPVNIASLLRSRAQIDPDHGLRYGKTRITYAEAEAQAACAGQDGWDDADHGGRFGCGKRIPWDRLATLSPSDELPPPATASLGRARAQ